MASQTDSPVNFTAGEDFSVAFLRVKADGRTVYKADAVDYGIGCVQEIRDSGETIAVRIDGVGTSKMIASAEITAGEKVYGANDGKVAPTGSKVVGTALDTASGNNSVIEVLPHQGLNQSSSSSSSSSGGGS